MHSVLKSKEKNLFLFQHTLFSLLKIEDFLLIPMAVIPEIVQLLEIRVHDNLLLVSVLERFTPGNGSLCTRRYGGTSLQASHVAAENVHDHRLRDIIRVVTSHYFVNSKRHRTAVESLAPENAAKSTIILETNLRYNFIHGPPVQVLAK